MTGRVVHALSNAPYDLYVGRSMPRYGLFNNVLANPFRVGRDGDLEEVLDKYERMVRGRIEFDEPLAATVYSLRDSVLACWCAPKEGPGLTIYDELICHGQVLLKLAEEMRS